MIINPGVVGIDISKHHLDVFDAALGRVERIANQPQAIGAWAVRWAASGAFVLFEATGHYDAALRQTLSRQRVRFARVNPGRARDFARAAGFLAKTDAIDARMLAAMAQCLRPSPEPAPEPARERLALLHKRRDQLVGIRQQERTRRRECPLDAIADDLDRHLAFLDAAIATLDADIRALLAQSPALDQAGRLLRSAPGIGPVTAATLLALMPELGARSPKTIAALAGLAPFNADSGKHRGKRCIRAGRKRVRDALYMAAVAASRSHTRFGAFYRALRQAGKPPKLAFIALARKILITLNAMTRENLAFKA
jgi:transposase